MIDNVEVKAYAPWAGSPGLAGYAPSQGPGSHRRVGGRCKYLRDNTRLCRYLLATRLSRCKSRFRIVIGIMPLLRSERQRSTNLAIITVCARSCPKSIFLELASQCCRIAFVRCSELLFLFIVRF